MGFKNKGKGKEDFDNPYVPEDYYWGIVKDINHYSKEYEDGTSHKVRVTFEIDHDGEEVEIPYFAPANISVNENADDSNLATDLKKLGLFEVAAKAAAEVEEAGEEAAQGVISGDDKYCIEDESDVENFIETLKIVFDGKKFRVNVVDMEPGESSVVGKLSEFKARDV